MMFDLVFDKYFKFWKKNLGRNTDVTKIRRKGELEEYWVGN